VPLGPLPAGGTWSVAARLDAGPCAAQSSTAAASLLVHAPDLEVSGPLPGVTARGCVPAVAGYPGETVAYRAPPHAFVVRNRGATAETIEVGATTDLGNATVEGGTLLHLGPGENRTVPVLHTLPDPAGRLAGNVTLV